MLPIREGNATEGNVAEYVPCNCGLSTYDWNYFDSLPEHHIISDANSLYAAYKAAKKGSAWKPQVQRFEWDALSEIRQIQEELEMLGEDGGYRTSPYTEFFVNERGKIRPITGLQMRDRVVRHSLCDNVLTQAVTPHLIYDNGASLKGKGVDFTRNRLVAHLETYFRKHGSNDGYIMILDYSKFYDNIPHKKAMQMIRKYANDEFAEELTEDIFKTFRVDVSYMSDLEYANAMAEKYDSVSYRMKNYPKFGEKFIDKSVSVGDQTSQIVAVSYPTPVDKLITVVKGYGLYARYMDDSYVIAETKEELLDLLEDIKEMCDRLGLYLNEKKTKIVRLSDTFRFLQNRYFLRENGYVVIRINQKTVTRMRRKLKKLSNKVKTGQVTREAVEEMFRSWIAARMDIMSKRQIQNMITLYQNSFGNDTDKWFKARGIIQ